MCSRNDAPPYEDQAPRPAPSDLAAGLGAGASRDAAARPEAPVTASERNALRSTSGSGTPPPEPEALLCTCGRPVRVVRLGKSLLTLGHLDNGTHPVTLARTPSRGDEPTAPSADVVAPAGSPQSRKALGRPATE